MKNIKYCLACNNILPCEKLYEYVQCPSCNSFVYISDRPADQENKAYFDAIFKTLECRENSSIKLKIFSKCAQKDQSIQKKQYADFYAKKECIMQHLYSSSRVLEIGFGSGEHLSSLLQRGIDAYGVDLSSTAVENFQDKYPAYANRVQCGTRFNQKVDIIYCCALFEHLDHPWQFIQDASNCLGQNGLLIIDGLPIVNEGLSDITADEDISFWKPCHRAIYSTKGLDILFSRHEFTTTICAVHDDYNYRALSMHVKFGYRKVIELRSLFMRHKELPRLIPYYCICRNALHIHSLAYHGCIMFRKQ